MKKYAEIYTLKADAQVIATPNNIFKLVKGSKLAIPAGPSAIRLTNDLRAECGLAKFPLRADNYHVDWPYDLVLECTVTQALVFVDKTRSVPEDPGIHTPVEEIPQLVADDEEIVFLALARKFGLKVDPATVTPEQIEAIDDFLDEDEDLLDEPQDEDAILELEPDDDLVEDGRRDRGQDEEIEEHPPGEQESPEDGDDDGPPSEDEEEQEEPIE